MNMLSSLTSLDPGPLTLATDEEAMVIVAIIVGLIMAHVVLSNFRRMYQTRQREVTRREIAAYVAEGSIAPEDAAVMMASDHDDFETKIADGVTWGTISAEKAEKLIKSRRDARNA